MKQNENNTIENIFGPIVYSYTRAQAVEDGVLIDVTKTAKEAGITLHTVITHAVYADYVVVPEGLKQCQGESGRLWDILWMFSHAVRSGRMEGSQGTYEVIVAKPDKGDWQSNERTYEGNRSMRLVTLKAHCGPGDQGEACITIMRPDED